MGIHGKRLFGQVHRVPGLFYVSTVFYHLNYVPLFPLGSYLVLDSSKDGEVFQGARIRMSFRSVLTGYLRGWLGATALFFGGVGAAATASFYAAVPVVGVVAALTAAAATFAALWFVFNTRTRWFLAVQLVFIAASAVAYQDIRTQFPDAARVPGAALGTRDRKKNDASYVGSLLIANAAAALYSLTRLFTPGSYRRALDLARQTGIPAELVAERFGEDPTMLPTDASDSGGGNGSAPEFMTVVEIPYL